MTKSSHSNLVTTVILDSELYTKEFINDMETLFGIFESTHRIKLIEQNGIKYTFHCYDEEIYNLIENLAEYGFYETLEVE